MAGIAPWLALPDDNTEESKVRSRLRTELLKGLKNAVDPQNPDYLNFRTEKQPIVDCLYGTCFYKSTKSIMGTSG
jgi:hypothetical protein